MVFSIQLYISEVLKVSQEAQQLLTAVGHKQNSNYLVTVVEITTNF